MVTPKHPPLSLPRPRRRRRATDSALLRQRQRHRQRVNPSRSPLPSSLHRIEAPRSTCTHWRSCCSSRHSNRGCRAAADSWARPLWWAAIRRCRIRLSVRAAACAAASSARVRVRCPRHGCATRRACAAPNRSSITHPVCAAPRRCSIIAPATTTWTATTAPEHPASIIPVPVARTSVHSAGAGWAPCPLCCPACGATGPCAAASSSARNVIRGLPDAVVAVRVLARAAGPPVPVALARPAAWCPLCRWAEAATSMATAWRDHRVADCRRMAREAEEDSIIVAVQRVAFCARVIWRRRSVCSTPVRITERARCDAMRRVLCAFFAARKKRDTHMAKSLEPERTVVWSKSIYIQRYIVHTPIYTNIIYIYTHIYVRLKDICLYIYVYKF